MTGPEIALLVFGLLGGAIIGSFVCVIIDRLPVRLDEPNEYNEEWDTLPWRQVVGGTSRCSSCGAGVRPWHNIPIVSWFLLRGRCPDCGERIPGFHPTVEFAVPAIGALIVWGNVVWGDGVSWVLPVYLWLVPVGLAVSVIDWRTLIVPTRLIWPGFFVAVALTGVAVVAEGQPRLLLGALVGVAVLAGPLFTAWWVYPRGMGFGDVRLTVLLGWTLGVATVANGGPLPAVAFICVLVIVVSALVGIVIGVLAAMTPLGGGERLPLRKQPVPFGPPLVLTTLAALVVIGPLVDPLI